MLQSVHPAGPLVATCLWSMLQWQWHRRDGSETMAGACMVAMSDFVTLLQSAWLVAGVLLI